MSTFEKIVVWVIFFLLIALFIGCIGAFAYNWTWHNLVLAALAIIMALSVRD